MRANEKLKQINKEIFYYEKGLKNLDKNSPDYKYIQKEIEYLRQEQRRLINDKRRT